VEDLKAHIHGSTTVPVSQLYLALPSGHVMENREQVSTCIMEGSIGMLYLFSTALEPSFKMMTDTSPAISTLVVNGDESIPKEERREVYSHTFFHIRQQYHLFERLHKGHKSMLMTIHRQCVQVREQESALSSAYHSVDALTSYIHHMQQSDMERLRSVIENGKDPTATNTLASWERLAHQLQEYIQTLSSLGMEIARLHQETETFLRLAEDLKSASEQNENVFYEFYQQYVIPARKIYWDAKNNQGVSTIGHMADVLVGAKQQAEKIILERLNGYNCAKQYVAMVTLLTNLSRRKDELTALKRQVMELNDHQRNDLWKLVHVDYQSKAHQYENCFPVSHSMSSSASDRDDTHEHSHGRTWSQMSADSTDSEMGDQLERSLKKLTRLISVPENEKLEEENKVLLTRLSSVVEQLSLGSSNGPTVAMESSPSTEGFPDASTLRGNWIPSVHYHHH
jgi:hypothetical protein